MEEQLTFEFEKRKPIKGFPELHWTGKRPFNSTQYYPAQLRESYGTEQRGWLNKIFWGDNLQVMSHLLKEFRGQIDLIYIDPPFDSKADYKKKIEIREIGKAESDSSSFEEKQYGDIWTNDEYLQFMYERLILMRELLSDKGSIYLHCDWHKAAHLKLLLDEVFGCKNILNEIIWYYRRWTAASDSFQKMHDTIFLYSKTGSYTFNPIYIDATEGQQKKHERGYDRNSVFINGVRKPQLLIYDQVKTSQAIKNGNINLSEFARVVKVKETRTIAHDVWFSDVANSFIKVEMEDERTGIGDLWEINYINSQSKERTNYPTQKPQILLERIIEASSNPGDIVFDCFMGSGTTQAVAMKLGRRFIGADINLGAIQTTTKRLLSVAKQIEKEQQENLYKTKQEPLDLAAEKIAANGDYVIKESSESKAEIKYTGFEVYNVNNYDFFRNPLEARDLLISALEIQPFPSSDVWDGELDGRMVKIMPVNRIATKADLEELLPNLPYKTYEKRKEENPNKPVELITIVCMGHEPDLKGELEKKLFNYKVDIEIVDILRDKADLQLKREAEAEVVKEGRKLVIRSFYPMNLMQKLSLQKEYVEDWRQLVDSIMIDWNYDGAVMQPTVTDVPGKNEMVNGVYDIPEDAGTIKVKITDLLSESLEVEVR
ncbi:MAG: site-specific DNA-methyltransferase [Acidaminococcaceae bacterium]|nr:site-specific DNA-methyltransferase [Acidaminococcaceae bacterium]MBQ5344991.1 site-specific DNA-methyltransferase [Acidaminococcaceae bacterium]